MGPGDGGPAHGLPSTPTDTPTGLSPTLQEVQFLFPGCRTCGLVTTHTYTDSDPPDFGSLHTLNFHSGSAAHTEGAQLSRPEHVDVMEVQNEAYFRA
jgi:hypothetical protein